MMVVAAAGANDDVAFDVGRYRRHRCGGSVAIEFASMRTTMVPSSGSDLTSTTANGKRTCSNSQCDGARRGGFSHYFHSHYYHSENMSNRRFGDNDFSAFSCTLIPLDSPPRFYRGW